MKIIYKIARAELRNLFYSPVAWFVVLVFYVFASALFFLYHEQAAALQEAFLEFQPDWIGFQYGVSKYLLDPVMLDMTKYLYMFLPLLTMGVMNREFQSGTIKLLYSSPLRTREIILGKYLGLVAFNLIFLLGLALVLFTASFTIENAESQWYLSILLGLFLLVNAYAAIGLFISCLTNYQIVAAVLTFAVFFLLSAISGLWQQYDFVRDITNFLSMPSKSFWLLQGLITSRDILYFLLIIVLFLAFAMIRIRSTQESKKKIVVFSRYGLALVAVLTLGYFTSRPGYILYYDTTKNQYNTIHEDVQAVLKKLDGSPVTVTLYTNLLAHHAASGLPQARNRYLALMWEKYTRFYPQLEFRYEYFYGLRKGDSTYYRKYPGKTLEEIAALEAEVLGIRPSLFKKAAELDNLAALEKEDLRVVMELNYKGRKVFLRTFDDQQTWPDQEDVAGAFMKLVRPKDVKVSFLTGHYERDPTRFTPRDYGRSTTFIYSRKALTNKGVETDTISIADKDIPAGTDLLVVADPRSAYNQEELNRIDRYLRSGGNALFFAEPGKQHILAPVLEKIGVQVDAGMIVHPNPHEMPHIAGNKLTREGNLMAGELSMDHFIRYGTRGGQVVNEGTANISVKAAGGFKVEEVITQPGNENTWIENGHMLVDSAAPVFDSTQGDVRKASYTIAVKLTRQVNGKEQRILVAGDADFMSANRFERGNIYHAFYSWGLNNQYPVYAIYPLPVDRFLTISAATAGIITRVYVYLIPALLLLFAIILLVRRKRK